MKNLNFLSKSSSQSCSHSSVTLASTVGSPSVDRRWTMLKLISVLVLILTIGVGHVWGADVVVTLDNIGSGLSSTANTTAATTAITATGTTDSYILNYYQCKKQGNSMLMTSGQSPYISNKTAMPGNIKSVEVFINSGAAKKTTYDCAFSTTECTSATSGIGAVNITGGNSHTYSNLNQGVINVKGKYFCVTLGNANNGQVLKLVITCEGSTSSDPVAVTGVTLDESTITLDPGDTQLLTATVAPNDASNKTVSWTSSNTSVATVDAGLVTAVAAGEATITATTQDGSFTDECTVTVTDVTKSSLIFTAACGGSGTADDDAEWKVTSDGTESSFLDDGIHYGTSSASVTYVQLSTSDIKGTITKVVVRARDTQEEATVSVSVGGTAFTCSGSTTATNTSANYTFTGSGSGEIIVRVDRGSSMTKAIYVKSVIVTYESCNELASINGSVSLSQTTATLTWDKLANVGTWAVTYKADGGSESSANVTISDQDANHKQAEITGLTPNTHYTFYITASDATGYCETSKTWSDLKGSTDPSWTITALTNNAMYGSVSREGSVITGTPELYCTYANPAYTLTGNATVTQNGNDFTITDQAEDITIVINFEPIPVTGVTMSSDAETLEVGGKVTLTAEVAPYTVNPNVTWESSNTNIATVDGGTVTAVAAGSATITATSVGDDTKKATCAITVVPVTAYKKVTANLDDWSGEYLLVYENSASEAYVWTGVEATNCYATATISNNKITKPTNGVKLVVAAMENEGEYSIKVIGGTQNGKYIHGTSGANDVKFSDDAEPNTISVLSGNASITSNTSFMQYNSADNQKRFRYYKSGTTSQKDVQLYRKVVTAAVTVTDPAEGTGSLSVTGASLAAVEAGSELTVTATPNSGNHYIGGTVTVTKTVGGDDVTAAVYSNGTITMPEYAITVSASFTPTYAITGASVVGGSFSWEDENDNVDPAYVAAGVYVQASANATAGYVFSGTYDIYQTGASSTKVDHTDGLFEMPAHAVTIGGSFNVAPSIILSQTETMVFAKVATGAPVSNTFTINAANLTAGSLNVTKSGANPDKFNLSASSITVTAGAVTDAEVTVTPITTTAGDYSATITVDDGDGGAAAQSFNVTLHVEDQYIAKWWVNGVEQTTYSVTEFAGADLTFPDAPTPAGDCAGTEFMGWLTAPLDEASADEPDGLIKTYTGHTMPAANVNYYAVFAEETPGEEVEDTYSHTIEAKTWEDNNVTEYTLSDVNWTLSKTGGNYWGHDATKGQQIGSGSASASAMSLTTSGISGKITSVKIYTSGAKDVVATVAASVNGVAYKNNNSTSPVAISSTNTGYEFTGSETGEIVISWAQTSSKALYFKQIEVRYAAPGASTYSNYVTTCVACSNVSLVEAGETNGTITLKQGTKEVSSVKTCNGAVTLTTNAVAATGYELTNIAVSGVANATVNQEMTEITIPANATGELTVTATFSQKNYEVIVEEYPVIGATLTGATTTAHYNDDITISTNEPAGYKFSGWCMYEVTDIERETDIADQFFTGDYDEYEFATTAKFKMPNRSIVAEANFKKIYSVDEFMDTEFTKTNNKWYYVTGLVAEVPAELHNGTKMTYVISDDASKSGLYLTLYRGLGEDSENFSAVSDLAVGDKVVVYGQWSSSYKNLNEGNYIIKDCLTKKALSVLTIAGDASVTTYDVGDSFDKTGLSLTATYNTGYVIANYTGTTITSDYDAPTTFTAGVTKVTVSAEEGLISTSRDIPVTVSSAVLDHVEISSAAQTEFWAKEQYKEPLLDAYLTDDPATVLQNVTGVSNTEGLDMSVAGNKSVTVTYTRKVGQSDDVEYNFTVKAVVVDEAHAHSVATAREIIDVDNDASEDLNLADNATKTHVKGIVKSVQLNSGLTGGNAQYNGTYNIVITDEADATKEMTLYRVSLKSGITSVEENDLIKVCGNLYWYEGGSKYEINTGGQVVWKQPKASIEISNQTLEIDQTLAIADVASIEPAGAAVSYAIAENENNCITLNEGVITATAVGTATVSINVDAYEEYLANSKTFTVTVKPAAVHTNVVILAEYDGHYYALNNAAKATEVAFCGGKVVVADEATKNAILWDRAERGTVATFYNATVNKYLNGSNSTTLGVAASEGTYTSWTWKEAGYYTSNTETQTIRTFLYRASADNGFMNYAQSNKGTGDYAGYAVIYTGEIIVGEITTLRGELANGQWGTYCPAQNVVAYEGATFYTIAYVEKQSEVPYKVFYDEIGEGESLQAGHPYIFIADEDATAIKGVKVGDAATEGINDNGFIGKLSQYDFYVSAEASNAYKYYIVYGNEIRRCGEGWFRISAERAYLDMTAGINTVANAPAAGRRRVCLTNKEVQIATGVDQVQSDQVQSTKVLINGELFILRGEKMYDATGRLVK